MSKKLQTTITLFLLPIVFIGTFFIVQQNRISTVRAFGHLTVDMGVPSGDPIFVINNFMPGDCEVRNVTITNNDTSPIETAVRSDNESQTNNLPNVLNIEITESSNVLYSQTVAQFFADSDGLDGVSLSTLNPSDTKTYSFKVCFDENAGNEYQNSQTIFDLIFGEVISPIQLPAECSHLQGIITQKIEGTSGNDRIRGTSENELIIGYGGNDRLDGAGGSDCIVGGNGNDSRLDGGQGTDVILGGPGNDVIDGSQGDDLIYGQDGDDEIDGGSGEDTIYGGQGNDVIDSGSGDDTVYGEEGNDDLDGGSGTDYLNGGNGTDKIDGGPAKNDDCDEGENLKSCEL